MARLTRLFSPKSIAIFGGLKLKWAELVAILGAVAAVVFLWLLTSRTRVGLAWRATVTDPQMAESFGISIARVRHLNFFIGSAMAGAGGIMVGMLNNLVEPTMGSVPSYKAMAIIVLGGLGSVPGTLLASLSLGIVESFGSIYLSDFLDRDAIAFAFLIVILMFRPAGLLGRR